MRSRLFKISAVVLVLSGLAFLTYQMLRLAQYECQLCVEFRDGRECPRAFGPSPEEAADEAHRNACALLASGVTEVLACNRAQRLDLKCRPRGGEFSDFVID